MDKYCDACATFSIYRAEMDSYFASTTRVDFAAHHAAEVKADWVTYRVAYFAYRDKMDAYATEVRKNSNKINVAYASAIAAYRVAMGAYYAAEAEKVVAERFAASVAAIRFADENAANAAAPQAASCLVLTKRMRRDENNHPSKRVCFEL